MKQAAIFFWTVAAALCAASALAADSGFRRPGNDRTRRPADGARERREILEGKTPAAGDHAEERKRLEAEAEARRTELEKKRAEFEARRAELEKQRAEWEARKAEMEKKRADLEEKKAELERRREEERRQWEEKQKQLEQKGAQGVDQRQEYQERRIQHGVRRGYLTPEEAEQLQAQQQALADLEAALTEDGRLTRTEFAQLREALNTASRMIWAEKHDSEGAPMPVYRLGRNVFAADSLTAALSNPDLTRAEARTLLADFRRLLALQHRLSVGNLSEEERAEIQARYDELLNTYLVTK